MEEIVMDIVQSFKRSHGLVDETFSLFLNDLLGSLSEICFQCFDIRTHTALSAPHMFVGTLNADKFRAAMTRRAVDVLSGKVDVHDAVSSHNG